jgi:DNA-binding NtrC family response regulator
VRASKGMKENMKILIVDDNKNWVFIVQLMLEEEGFEVRSAFNGETGYSAYLSFKPNLIITDIQMPSMNGMELISRIREHDRKVKTIYMSSEFNGFRSFIEKEKDQYEVDLLKKPFSKEELLRLVSKFSSEQSKCFNGNLKKS